MFRPSFSRFVPVAFALLLSFSASASAQLLTTSYFDGAVKQYSLSGSGLQGFANLPGANGVVGPGGIVVAPNNDILFTAQGSNGGDASNNAIFRFSATTGLVTTFVSPAQLSTIAGGGGAVYGPTAIRFGPDGMLYVARGGGQSAGVFTGAIDRFTAAGVFDTTIVTGLTQPTGMLIDGNTMYVSNLGGPNVNFYGDVVKITNFTTSPIVSPFITTNSGGLENPTGLAIGPDGKFYVADVSYVGNSAVRKYNADGTFTGANSLLLAQPFGFTSDILFTGGQMIIANLGNPNFGFPGGIFAYNDTTYAFENQLAAGTGFSNLALYSGVVPEPVGLLALGLVGGLIYRRRK